MRTLPLLALLLTLAGCGDAAVCINASQQNDSGGSARGCIGSGCDHIRVECPIDGDAA